MTCKYSTVPVGLHGGRKVAVGDGELVAVEHRWASEGNCLEPVGTLQMKCVQGAAGCKSVYVWAHPLTKINLKRSFWWRGNTQHCNRSPLRHRKPQRALQSKHCVSVLASNRTPDFSARQIVVCCSRRQRAVHCVVRRMVLFRRRIVLHWQHPLHKTMTFESA